MTTLTALGAAGLFSVSTAAHAVPASGSLFATASDLTVRSGTLANADNVALYFEFDTDIDAAPNDGAFKLFDFGTSFINTLSFDPGVVNLLSNQTRIEVRDDFALPALPGVAPALVGQARDVLGFEVEFFKSGGADGAYVASVFLAFADDTFDTPIAYPVGTNPELAILRLLDLDDSRDDSNPLGTAIGAIEIQDLSVTAVPVPAALPLLGGALGLLALFRRRA
jgi:hypothetical protein